MLLDNDHLILSVVAHHARRGWHRCGRRRLARRVYDDGRFLRTTVLNDAFAGAHLEHLGCVDAASSRMAMVFPVIGARAEAEDAARAFHARNLDGAVAPAIADDGRAEAEGRVDEEEQHEEAGDGAENDGDDDARRGRVVERAVRGGDDDGGARWVAVLPCDKGRMGVVVAGEGGNRDADNERMRIGRPKLARSAGMTGDSCWRRCGA